MKNDKQKIVPTKGIQDRVINIRNKKINTAAIERIKTQIVDNPQVSEATKQAGKELIANQLKSYIATTKPELYKAFKDMSYEDLLKNMDTSKVNGTENDILTVKVPAAFIQAQTEAGIDANTYPTSFDISPNSYWANVTNILNQVSVGDNSIGFGKSFNAYEFFFSEELSTGEAVLRTMGSPLSGTFLLNQNQLVPQSTQEIAGYQASLGVFINTDSAQDVGGGTGIGMFTMYATPINVLQLAVTNPKQYAKMVRIFQATAENTKKYTLWVICTLNMLNGINNFVIDNYNNNVRNCLNGTLFPAINIIKTPTNEFNCGLINTQYYSTTNTPSANGVGPSTLTYSDLNNPTTMNNITYSFRVSQALLDLQISAESTQIVWNANTTGNPNPDSSVISTIKSRGLSEAFNTSVYLIAGSSNYPRIQTSDTEDIHLIITPQFAAQLKSGVMSQLFHYEFQQLEEYVKPENIHLLYKSVNIPCGYLLDNAVKNEFNQTGYAQQVTTTLGDQWIPNNCIYLITKPKDVNMWTANYGNVWTKQMNNTWGAGMIDTSYLHYAIWGGVLPWANGTCFYFKNLLNLVTDNTQAILTDFSLGTIADQTTYTGGSSGSGSN